MLVPRIIKMIRHMEMCQEEWKDALECKRSQALGMTEKTLSKAFDFTFDKSSKEIDSKETIPSNYRHSFYAICTR